MGRKFDPNEEPRYLERTLLITPAVKFLIEEQKEYLRDQLFFKDDPNFSFRGFREDLRSKSQAQRDKDFWPGAFPPVEPRSRPEYFKRNLASVGEMDPMATIQNTQGSATGGAQQRSKPRRWVLLPTLSSLPSSLGPSLSLSPLLSLPSLLLCFCLIE